MATGNKPGVAHKVAGFDVAFPHKPYGVQLVFMNQVLRAIDHQENALLEAPTGMACLANCLYAAQRTIPTCSIAMWVKHHIDATTQHGMYAVGSGKTLSLLCSALAWQTGQKQKAATARMKAAVLAQVELAEKASEDGTADLVDKPTSSTPDVPESVQAEDIPVPTIYYATRTHSQIAQVVPAGGPGNAKTPI